MTDMPSGVADGTLRDDVGVASSRSVVESFWSRGKLLPPVLGPHFKGTRVASYFGGSESVEIRFGDFGHATEVWTTLDGLAALIEDLQATLVRARIAQDAAGGGIPDEDIPF